ncbi:MAG: Fibronectin type domain protein [Pedosphaera sp.]|nr:Fibronectin type domain protein [Pedosphaera sp.]
MKKLILGIALIAMTGIANAALNAYEPFNYTTLRNGTNATGTGFTGNWTCGASPTIATGLTYPALSVANSALSSGSSRQLVSLSSAISSGTKYISFLYTASGNMGGNIDGVFFPNGNTTCLWFGFGLGPFSGTQGQLGLGSMTTAGTAAVGATSLKQVGLGNYASTYLIVLKIDFDTSGANDTVTVYTNPVANATAPGVTAAGTLSTYDVGAISGIGLNVQGGATITVDEIRVGDTYGDVVGFVPPPSAPTGLTATPFVNAVGLNWTLTSGATGYKVLRGTSTGVYTVTNNVASNTNYDSTAIGGTTYFYVVQATNSSGASASSSEVSVTPTIALPGTPTGLAAVGTNGAVNLSWSAAAGAASYNVKRSTTSGAEVTIATAGTTSYSDSAVVNGTQYFYKISSTNSAGESANSSEVSATPNDPPLAPTGLSAIAGSNQVSLAWTGSAGAVSYNVKRSTTSGSGYSTIGTTPDPTVAYIDSTAVKFTQYYYVVSAVNAYGESSNSSPEATATPTGAYGPSAYESFNYGIGGLANNTPSTATGFTGNWTVSGSPSIVAGLTYPGLPTGNNAYQHAAAGAQTTENLTSPLSSGTKFISFLFKGSGNSGGDTVGVFFKGNNANSLFAGFRVPDTGITTGFGLGSVNSTTLGSASALGSVVNINNTSVHLVVIEIDFNTSGANDTVSLWIDPPAGVITPGVAANVVNSSFDVGTISAVGINITGGYNPKWDEVRVGDVYGDVVGYLPPPDAPTGLAATAGVNAVSLSWNAVSGASSYNVLRGTSTGVYTVTNNVASNTNYDNTAVGGTTYFYVVQAVNATGPGASSSEVSATPTIALPGIPIGLAAVGTNGAVNLSWSAATGAASYNVKRSTSSGTEVTVANVAGNSYSDSAVVNGTQYFYKVSSTNSAGESADSSEVSATPDVPPATPTGLSATAGNSQVSLSWTAAAGAASYNIKRSTTTGAEVTIASAGSNNYIDTSAVKFTQYFYTVSAVSAYGESSDSSEVNATPTGTYGPSAYESFNYTLGVLANNTPSTATGFAGNWNVAGGPNIVAGLTYPGLPTSDNSYQHAAAGAQTTVNLATPLSTGTKYISFLMKGPGGDPGANACGVFLKGNNANSLFAGFEVPFSPTLTGFGLGTVNSTSLGGAGVLGATTAIDNSAVHLVVIKIDFNTAGANDTVSLWIDPPAGAITPGVAANVVNSTFDVGTISALGININGAFPIGLDEVRVGDVYGDVVGYSLTSPTPPSISLSAAGNQLTLSWPAGNLGWFLQAQTNAANVGISTNWVDVSGSETSTQSVITVDPTNPNVFFRLRSP